MSVDAPVGEGISMAPFMPEPPGTALAEVGHVVDACGLAERKDTDALQARMKRRRKVDRLRETMG